MAVAEECYWSGQEFEAAEVGLELDLWVEFEPLNFALIVE